MFSVATVSANLPSYLILTPFLLVYSCLVVISLPQVLKQPVLSGRVLLGASLEWISWKSQPRPLNRPANAPQHLYFFTE